MDSPYKHHLRTNYAPTAEDAQDIRGIIDAAEQELVALNAQVDEARRQLDPLLEKRSQLQACVDHHRELLSPIRKLTPDIFENIFLACLPSDRNPCMSASEAPMLLMRICSPWRQLALSFPRRWAAIHIVLPTVHLPEEDPADNWFDMPYKLVCEVLKRREAAVSEWLGKSGACTLSISVFQETPFMGRQLPSYYNSSFKEIQQIHFDFIINTVIPYHERWRIFDVRLTDATLNGILDIGLKSENLKSLKMLHVTRKPCFYEHREEQQDPRTAHQWNGTVALLPPHVTIASFDGIDVHSSDISLIPFQTWGCLTELYLAISATHSGEPPIITVNVAAEVLRHCHSLETLTLLIYCYEHDTPAQQATENIILTKLKTLSVSLPLSPTGLTFARLLRLPSLTELSIHPSGSFTRQQEEDASREILLVLLSSGQNINILTLGVSEWMTSPDGIVELLKLTPNLKHLKISGNQIYNRWEYYKRHYSTETYLQFAINDRLLKALSPKENESDLICPMLEDFDSGRDIKTGITEDGLKDFIRARKLDKRMANISRVSMFINAYKKEPVAGEEQLHLGPGSAIYFKKPKPISMSPFDGYKQKFLDQTYQSFPADVYTEL